MADELFEKILEQAAIMAPPEFMLFLNGEPLAFSRLAQYLQRLREVGLKTTIFTNGALLSEEKAKQIIEYRDIILHVVFSVPGIDDETHYAIQGLRHAQVRDRVQRFVELNEGEIPVELHMPFCEATAPFADEWEPYWRGVVGNGIPMGKTAMFNWAGKLRDRLEVTEGPMLKKVPCPRLRHLCVFWDGRVPLCCQDAEGDVMLGDVGVDTLLDIFNGELMAHYRNLHSQERWDELLLCRECNMNMGPIESVWEGWQ